MTGTEARRDKSGASPREALVPEWARDASAATGPGPSARLESLHALRDISEWLEAIRAIFSSRSTEFVEHLKTVEWFLDNHTRILRAARQVREDMPRSYFRTLPVLLEGDCAGLPRAYVVASSVLGEAELLPDSDSVRRLVQAIQRSVPLQMGELWALPTFLRLCALEQLATVIRHVVPSVRGPLLTPARVVACEVFDDDERAARCIRTIRSLDAVDWRDFFEHCSIVERVLESDPAGVYARSDAETRDRSRARVETIARRVGIGEEQVARSAVALAREALARADDREAPWVGHVEAYLIGHYRGRLEERLGYQLGLGERVRRGLKRHGVAWLIGGFALATALVLAVPATYLGALDVSITMHVLALLAAIVPASTLGISLVHWGLTSLLSPHVLPKLDFEKGIEEGNATLVAVPCLLGSAGEVQGLVREIELHYLRNPDPMLSFALLSDWVDAQERTVEGDEELLRRASLGIELLNRKYAPTGSTPFLLLHRSREWNPSEGVWMGWERKRGKLEQLNRLLLGDRGSVLDIVAGNEALLEGVRYVITLDAGSVLPIGAAARLVGTIGHPLNAPIVDPESGRVVQGYSVLQPRVEILPTAAGQSIFTRIFSGDAAIDMYTRAVSDVYQDVCGQGIYVGKGIYDVAAFSASLEGRVPENALVSHDHFEGLHARAALVSDIVLYEDYPPQYVAYARRMHRWLRGDWQLAPWLCRRVANREGSKERNRLTHFARWILFDNLRRSLLAPALLLLLAGAWLFLPAHPIFWTALAVLAPAGHVFTGLVSGLVRGPRRSRTRRWLGGIVHTFRQNVGRWALYIVFLPHEALVCVDAIARTIIRMTVTRRHLLEWRTAEHTARLLAARHPHLMVWAEMAGSPLIAVTLALAIISTRPETLPWAAPLLLLWGVAPEVARRIGREAAPRREQLTGEEKSKLRCLGRRTWLFFDTFVTPADQWLPPDNFQEEPRGEVAHRTSPTNIGMYVVSAVAAHDFGWVGSTDLAFRLKSTLETIERMETYRGHLLNWYDTRTLEPLIPRYVSSVDSGNLAAALLVAQQACAEAAAGPAVCGKEWGGILDDVGLLHESIEWFVHRGSGESYSEALAYCGRITSIAEAARDAPSTWADAARTLVDELLPGIDREIVRALGAKDRAPSPGRLREVRIWLDALHHRLRALHDDLGRLAPWFGFLRSAPDRLQRSALFSEAARRLQPTARMSDIPVACAELRDRLVELRTEIDHPSDEERAWIGGFEQALTDGEDAVRLLVDELLAFGVRAEELVRSMDFGLLFDDESRLLRIGYDVSNGRLDANHYDLLASEARIASFLAIAKGDVPVEHWFHLGRPVTRIRGEVLLLSWGGTMFEYLMPTLFMESSERTLLSQSCRAAVKVQIAFGDAKDVPWGISESGFYTFDAERNYQYRAFGVPGLGLRRGLADDLVVAPYASAIALEIRPRAVVANLERIDRYGGRGTYGLYEALDFTPGRAAGDAHCAVVRSHMAHHQGMVLAAIDNELLGALLVRRFHSTSLAQVAELLLHEQVPLGVSPSMHPKESVLPPILRAPSRGLEPWFPTIGGSLPDVHVLSNGHFSTTLTDLGGGWSTWHGLALTRQNYDGNLPESGDWLFVHSEDTGEFWSAGVDPTGIHGNDAQVTFQAHAVELRRRHDELFLRMEVAVSPREDVEVRLVTLTNESETTRAVTITSCAEPVLAPHAEDARHPAFSRLFVESEHLPDVDGLLFRRRPRGPDDRAVVLVRALVLDDVLEFDGFETDRARILGRGCGWDRPNALARGAPLEGTTGAVLDPVAALRARAVIPMGGTVRLAIVTAAALTEAVALELVGGIRTLEKVDWLFEDARASVAREVNAMRILPRMIPVIQQLTSLVHHARPQLRGARSEIEGNRLAKSGLWRLGISGDVPIVLVEVGRAEGVRLVSEVLLAHRWWRRCGVEVDLVLLLVGASSYSGDDEERVRRLANQSGAAEWWARRGGIFLLHADQIQPDELRLLRAAARVVLRGSDGRLADQVGRAWPSIELTPALVPTLTPSEMVEPTAAVERPSPLVLENRWGGFTPNGHEYVIHLPPGSTTPAPWCNVIANPEFGCLASENSLGMTWSRNSSERRLTVWRNDPVTDTPSEVLYLRDEETGEIWTPTPLPCSDGVATNVRHGAGWTEYERSSHGLLQSMRVWVPRRDPVKLVVLRVRNVWARPRRLTSTYFADLVLGTRREESASHVIPEFDAGSGTLLARTPWSPEHADRVSFLASDTTPHGVTADRAEFLGRGGTLANPAALGRWGLSGTVEPGAEPCHAMMVHIELDPGEERSLVFLLGDGEDRAHALELVGRYRDAAVRRAAWVELEDFWDRLLGAIEVHTPDVAMDIALNRWLLYQTVASRVEGRTGMYQSSGAFGYRDQLQDVMALVHGAPERARAHILEAARYQFEEGDVLHWWQPPGARGVRTRCSDDLLWLPFVASHYAAATGDLSIFHEDIPFLAGEPLGEGEHERYAAHEPSEASATLLEHCRRAVRRALTEGDHGLPLIGSCDWNDGFSRVGLEGAGESVWLAWFAIACLESLATILSELAIEDEAESLRGQAADLAERVEASAWDGEWYVRAWFDDGSPLGSKASSEGRIDLIAQAWAAISGVGDPDRTRTALESVHRELMDDEDDLVRLLAPPFDDGPQDPGYIRAYPPGIRENGGQYTHAAAWLGFAHAARGHGDAAEEVFRRINPLRRARSDELLRRYRVEPYVAAGDVYGCAPYTGRGGWTWYTGAASWMWRLGVERILGIERVGGLLRVTPCIPSEWSGFEARVRAGRGSYRILVENVQDDESPPPGRWLDGQESDCDLLPLDNVDGEHELLIRIRAQRPTAL